MARKRVTRRSHGQGTVYAKNGRWSISWREGGVRRYAHGFSDEATARDALARIVNSIDQGLPGAPPPKKLVEPLADLASEWLKRRQTTHRSAADDDNRWLKHLGPAFGHLQPDDVDEAAIRRFVESKLSATTGKLATNTVGNCVRLLSTFYTDLVERKLATTKGGKPGAAPRFLQIHTLHRHLAAALATCKLPRLTWYQATRHTYASQGVMAGGSLERLRDLMGHDSVLTTERYAHLKPDHFREADFDRLAVDLSRPAGAVANLGAVGYRLATGGAKSGSGKDE